MTVHRGDVEGDEGKAAGTAPDISPSGLTLQIGKYEVQQLLGKGSTGTVYLAKDTFTGREVALKTIEPEVFRDPQFGAVHRAQFQNEASLAGKIRHPHIVAIYDAVVGEDSGHIAMELVTGGDLSRHVKPGALLPVSDVLQIAFKCCGALDYAYREQGIVHRDIKPANLMLAAGTEVKIADFGAAYLRRSKAVQTTAMGSPFYMAPEQIEGRNITFHSDMYSLGVVLYELLTGRRPFVADSLQALIQKILIEEPPPPSALRPGLARQIDGVVLRAMRKNPAERFGTWAQFSAALCALVELTLERGAIADSEKYLAISRVEMLQALSDAQFWEVVAAGKWSRIQKGKVVLKEEDSGRSFFFLAKGEAKVTRAGRGLNLIGESEFFGEMAYIRGTHERRHATVESLTDLLLAEFEPGTLDQMSLEAQLQLSRALIRNVVERLALANTRIVGS